MDHLKGLRGPIIVVANHVSHLDTPIILRILPAAIRSLLVVAAAKDYFYRGRLRGSLVSLSLATVPFDRGEGSRESLSECEHLLRLGRSLLMFPEGTRSSTGHLGHIRSGVSVLAIHTRTPVLPLFIHGLGDVMPKGAMVPLPAGVVVDVGVPLLPEPDEEIATFRDRVESALVVLASRRPEWGARSSKA
ncbi:MAG: lysophospholipid acyltransferase family protein [Actinomycetota bacterium]